jgi:serralysin
MKAGRTYQIDMMQKPGALAVDPFLRLEDSQGNQLASDDDGGEGLNARIVFACTQDGTYRVVATTLDAQTGGFTLSVEER